MRKFFSGPFRMAFSIMPTSAISITVNSTRKMKNVVCTEPTSSLEMAALCGQHILNGPRLTSALGNHPTGLSGKITQRNGQHRHPMHPAHLRQILLVGKNENHDEEEDEVPAQYHHATQERLESERHVGNQFVHIRLI